MVPKVTTRKTPHWHTIIEFPNGNQVMVCDASGDDDLGDHDVVVTGIYTGSTPIMYRIHQEAPDKGITHRVADMDIVKDSTAVDDAAPR